MRLAQVLGSVACVPVGSDVTDTLLGVLAVGLGPVASLGQRTELSVSLSRLPKGSSVAGTLATLFLHPCPP